MAVSSVDTLSGPYTTNGVTTTFPFTFKAMAEGEVRVFRMAADGVETIINPGAYDVTLNDDGGSVVFTSAPAVGDPLYVGTDPDFTQQITFENQGAFLPEVMNEAFDRAATRDLALKGDIDRAPKRPLNWEDFEGLYPYLKADGTWGFSVSPGADGELRIQVASGLADLSQQRAMFKRSVYTEAPFYNTALLSAISTYGYSYLYPQHCWIDEEAQELITLHCPSGGANSWSWFVVWDISNPAAMPLPAKTTFSFPTTQWRESVIVRSISGVRYLEFLDNFTLVRVNINTLPANGSAVSSAATFAINCFPWITYDPVSNRYLAGDGRGGPGGAVNKDLFLWRDGDDPTIITGKVRLPFLAVGSNRAGYINALPKGQGHAVFNGLIYVGAGGVGGSADNISNACGLMAVSQDGRLVASALAKQSNAQAIFGAYAGRTLQIVENEGVCVAGGSLYGLWQTLAVSERGLPIAQQRGIIIAREMDAAGLDFSPYSQPASNPFSIEEFERTIHVSSSQLTDPVTGDTLDSFGEILDMMSNIGIMRYRFYGTNQTLTDIDGASVTVSGTIVSFEMAGGTACLITISGNERWARYWITPVAGTRVQFAPSGQVTSAGNFYVGADNNNNATAQQVGARLAKTGQVINYTTATVARYVGLSADGNADSYYLAGAFSGGVALSARGADFLFDTTRRIGTCTGTPEGQITANIGSIMTRKDGGVGTTLYVKRSGTGNTGWFAVA